MTISTTCFTYNNILKQTWISPCGYVRSQLDNTIVDSRIKSSVTDVRSTRGSSVLSDYFFVRIKMTTRISTGWRNKQKYKEKINDLIFGRWREIETKCFFGDGP
jgi:hypothetical protein